MAPPHEDGMALPCLLLLPDKCCKNTFIHFDIPQPELQRTSSAPAECQTRNFAGCKDASESTAPKSRRKKTQQRSKPKAYPKPKAKAKAKATSFRSGTEQGRQSASKQSAEEIKPKSAEDHQPKPPAQSPKPKAKATSCRSGTEQGRQSGSNRYQKEVEVKPKPAEELKDWCEKNKADIEGQSLLARAASSERESRLLQAAIWGAVEVDKTNMMTDCRDVQRSWPWVKSVLKGIQRPEDVVSACRDSHSKNSSWVLRMVMDKCPPCLAEFIFEALNQKANVSPRFLHDVATDEIGSRVIQPLLRLGTCSHCSRSKLIDLKKQLIDHMLCMGGGFEPDEMCDDLLQTRYGNYVCQAIMQFGYQEHRQLLFRRISENFVPLARHQFAAWAIEARLRDVWYSGRTDSDSYQLRRAMEFAQSILDEKVLEQALEKEPKRLGKGGGQSSWQVMRTAVIEMYLHVRECSLGDLSSIEPKVPLDVEHPPSKTQGETKKKHFDITEGFNRNELGLKGIDCKKLGCRHCLLRECFSEVWSKLQTGDRSYLKLSSGSETSNCNEGSKFPNRLKERLQEAFKLAPSKDFASHKAENQMHLPSFKQSEKHHQTRQPNLRKSVKASSGSDGQSYIPEKPIFPTLLGSHSFQ
mmetsp:Transcript_144231/g.250203  ORF Transcript_144231/g.250203 Transcript_144231/m.250203 type:complete len:638 (-) Transcript_144231:121-2034(-)